MGLAVRIIPVLLARNRMLVKGKQFKSDRIVGNVQQAAEINQAREVDEMVVLDVSATEKGSIPNYQLIRSLTEKCFMPIAVGGGITELEHIRLLLANGADKVVIGTAAIENPDFIREASKRFGAQAIVIAVDAVHDVNNWYIACRNAKQIYFQSAVSFAEEMERLGAGEIMLTSVKNEGMMGGYDLGLIKKVAKAVSVPVIANGGCGTYEHMRRALAAGASAVAAGAMFQWTENTPKGAAEYLASKGLETRL
jgi:cyclase